MTSAPSLRTERGPGPRWAACVVAMVFVVAACSKDGEAAGSGGALLPSSSPTTASSVPASAPTSTSPLLYAKSFDDTEVFSVPVTPDAATLSMLTVVGDTVVGLAGRCDGAVGVQAIAFDRHTGARRWATPLPGAAETSPWTGTADGGVTVFETAVERPGYEGPDSIYAIDDHDGSERWRRAMPGGPIDPSVSATVIVGRLNAHELIGLDRTTGAQLWDRQIGDQQVIAVSNAGLLFLVPAPGSDQAPTVLSVVDADTGADRWQVAGVDVAGGDRSAIVADRVSDAGVVALDRATGAELWHRDDAVVSPGTGELAVGARVVVLKLRAGAGMVIASLMTGATLWPLDTQGLIDGRIVDGVVLHGRSADGQRPGLELFDAASGRALGVVTSPPSEGDQVAVPPAIADDVLYGGRGCPGRG